MRFKIIIIGISIVLFSIPGYTTLPSLMTREMNKLTGGNEASTLNSQIFSQIGIPPIDTIITAIQYSFLGLIVAGLGIIGFGIISKKISKRPIVKASTRPNQRLQEEEEANLKVLHLLQERLAKGEITPGQYQSLKKLIEDKI